MEAVLSPNGQSRFDGGAPPTKLIVATATGVKILERERLGAPWQLAATALEKHHMSTMTMLPGGRPVPEVTRKAPPRRRARIISTTRIRSGREPTGLTRCRRG